MLCRRWCWADSVASLLRSTEPGGCQRGIWEDGCWFAITLLKATRGGGKEEVGAKGFVDPFRGGGTKLLGCEAGCDGNGVVADCEGRWVENGFVARELEGGSEEDGAAHKFVGGSEGGDVTTGGACAPRAAGGASGILPCTSSVFLIERWAK
jgi:hypothetical protein